jgi:hypothetical protein
MPTAFEGAIALGFLEAAVFMVVTFDCGRGTLLPARPGIQ